MARQVHQASDLDIHVWTKKEIASPGKSYAVRFARTGDFLFIIKVLHYINFLAMIPKSRSALCVGPVSWPAAM